MSHMEEEKGGPLLSLEEWIIFSEARQKEQELWYNGSARGLQNSIQTSTLWTSVNWLFRSANCFVFLSFVHCCVVICLVVLSLLHNKAIGILGLQANDDASVGRGPFFKRKDYKSQIADYSNWTADKAHHPSEGRNLDIYFIVAKLRYKTSNSI